MKEDLNKSQHSSRISSETWRTLSASVWSPPRGPLVPLAAQSAHHRFLVEQAQPHTGNQYEPVMTRTVDSLAETFMIFMGIELKSTT
jgi:hypothetical protein